MNAFQPSAQLVLTGGNRPVRARFVSSLRERRACSPRALPKHSLNFASPAQSQDGLPKPCCRRSGVPRLGGLLGLPYVVDDPSTCLRDRVKH
jgi:hypothetical protein